jgi:1-acyl-sn-glycerol-3-phosphate acyltransferase
MYYFFVTIECWIVFIITCLVMFPVALITRVITYTFDKKLILNQVVSCFWASVLSWLNPLWDVHINGREKIKKSTTYVLISNHQSMADILVLYRLFKHFKWVSKIELFKLPFVGWNMSLNQYVKVDRGKHSGHIRMINESEAHLRNGSSIMIFPEGTRSKSGEINTFKDGAFRLAQSTKVPIVPIVIDGTLNCFPKKGLIFQNRCSIVINILDPIPYETFSDISAREVANMTHDIIKRELGEMRLNNLKI